MQKRKKAWEYLITISGGGGHLTANKALESSREKKNIPVKVLDLMRSSASFGKATGRFFTDIWDNAQKKGDISKLKKLIKKEYLIDVIMYFSCVYAITKDLLSEATLPSKIRITHPICLPAIFSAIELVNMMRKNTLKKIDSIDLYMTDFPTDKSEHFYSALKRLSHLKRWAKRIVLHSPPPSKQIKNVQKFWKEMTSIDNLQVIEEDIPISKEFEKKTLPSPQQPCRVQLTSHVPCEKKFHHHLSHTHPKLFSTPAYKRRIEVSIDKDDKVGLIMLGSQPTYSAVMDYLQQMLDVQSTMPDQSKNNVFLFIACGNNDLHRNELLEKTIKKICNSPLKSYVHIIPFSRQSVYEIFGRADITVTRSGGLTTAELLTIKRHGASQNSKRILIHTEKLSSKQQKAKPSGMDIMTWRNCENNPLWERGNAEYLAEEFPNSVGISGPDTIVPELKYHLFGIDDERTKNEATKVLHPPKTELTG